MMNWIGSHIDERSLGERNVKFLKKMAQPTTLRNSMSNITIFCLCTGTGDYSLALRRPRD
jgi:hypothetical protein